MYGLNSDGAGRSQELLSVLSTRGYFTLASVASKDILAQLMKAKSVKTIVESYFLSVGINWDKRGEQRCCPVARISVTAKPFYWDPANRRPYNTEWWNDGMTEYRPKS